MNPFIYTIVTNKDYIDQRMLGYECCGNHYLRLRTVLMLSQDIDVVHTLGCLIKINLLKNLRKKMTIDYSNKMLFIYNYIVFTKINKISIQKYTNGNI